MVVVNVAEFATESGATPEVTQTVYPPSQPANAEPSARTKKTSLSKCLGDFIIEAFRSPQTDRVSVLAMQASCMYY